MMDHFSQACKDIEHIISQKKTNVLGQNVEVEPTIIVHNNELEVVHQFRYLGSTVSDNLSLGVEINKWFGKAESALARLITHDWGECQAHSEDQNSSVHCLYHQHSILW